MAAVFGKNLNNCFEYFSPLDSLVHNLPWQVFCGSPLKHQFSERHLGFKLDDGEGQCLLICQSKPVLLQTVKPWLSIPLKQSLQHKRDSPHPLEWQFGVKCCVVICAKNNIEGLFDCWLLG